MKQWFMGMVLKAVVGAAKKAFKEKWPEIRTYFGNAIFTFYLKSKDSQSKLDDPAADLLLFVAESVGLVEERDAAYVRQYGVMPVAGQEDPAVAQAAQKDIASYVPGDGASLA